MRIVNSGIEFVSICKCGIKIAHSYQDIRQNYGHIRCNCGEEIKLEDRYVLSNRITPVLNKLIENKND